MKILLTGCKGQLGIELINQLSGQKKRHTVIETDIHNLDITNEGQVCDLIKVEKPDIIINSAAYTNVDKCETDEANAFRVNAIGPRNLSVAANEIGSPIIQVSTDYVFNGTASSPRREYDVVNPASCYGRSKALGETLVMSTNPRHFIVRTAWLYGEGNNFVRTMLKLAQEKDELSVVEDQIGSPTSTVDLAKCIINLMDTEAYGIYHATCEDWCSWYDFALKIFELKSINIKVNRITTEELNRPANRPKYSVLENFMLNLMDLNTFRPWQEALEEYLRDS